MLPNTKRIGIYDGVDNLTNYDVNSLASDWHHLAVSSSAGLTRFYIDGAFVASLSQGVLLEVETVGNAMDIVSLLPSWMTSGSTIVRYRLMKFRCFTGMVMVILEYILIVISLHL